MMQVMQGAMNQIKQSKGVFFFERLLLFVSFVFHLPVCAHNQLISPMFPFCHVIGPR